MPDLTPEQEARQRTEFAARMVRRYASLQDLLEYSSDAGQRTPREELEHVWTQTHDWFNTLSQQIYDLNEDPPEIYIPDPFADFLRRGAVVIRDGAERAIDRHTGRLAFSDAYDWAGTACCIANAIWEMAGRPENEYEQLRAIERSEFVQWLRVFRECLLIIRELGQTGGIQMGLRILAFDISGQIQALLDQALVGPLIAAMVWFERITSELGLKVSKAVASTKCLPIIELWATILDWLYNERGGFMRRARGFAQSVLISLQRTIRASLNLGADFASGGNTEFDTARIQALIDLIDALLLSTDLLDQCRLAVPDREEDALGNVGNPFELPTDRNNRDNRDNTDRENEGPGRGTPGTGTNQQPFNPASEIDNPGYETTTYTTQYVGPEDLPEEYTSGDWVFLTPANIAYVLETQMGVGAGPAARVRSGESCRNTLSPETESVLLRLGVL